MDSKSTILVAEDDISILNFISTVLCANGFNVIKAKNGSEALMMITSRCPDLVLLDLGLPDVDGQRIITTVREWSRIPIIVVSARAYERDKVKALESGADDYITKPFGTAELIARVKTALRHFAAASSGSTAAQSGKFVSGELMIDYDKRRVFLNQTDVGLTNNEYKIVALLSKYSGKVLTYDFIIKNIWGPNATGDNQILRVNMANIRRKIEKNNNQPQYMFTEIGVGYRIVEAD